MPNDKNMKKVPKPVSGYKLKVNGEMYHYIANQDGWQHEYQPFLNLEPNAMVSDWELIPIVHELEWVDGNEFPLPMPTQGARLLIKSKINGMSDTLEPVSDRSWQGAMLEFWIEGQIVEDCCWFLFKA